MTTPILAIFGSLGIWEMLIIGAVALVVFGNRLPSAMRSLGQSFVSFKSGLREGEAEEAEAVAKAEAAKSAPLALEHKAAATASATEAAPTVSVDKKA